MHAIKSWFSQASSTQQAGRSMPAHLSHVLFAAAMLSPQPTLSFTSTWTAGGEQSACMVCQVVLQSVSGRGPIVTVLNVGNKCLPKELSSAGQPPTEQGRSTVRDDQYDASCSAMGLPIANELVRAILQLRVGWSQHCLANDHLAATISLDHSKISAKKQQLEAAICRWPRGP